MTYLSHLLIRQTLKILLNKKITEFTPLKPKHHWDLMLNMVFRRNSLVIFMDRLYLDNDFWTRFLMFYYFYCYYCCLLVFVLLFPVLLFCFIIIIIIITYSLNFFLILCGYIRYYFVKLLDSPINYVHDVIIPFYVIFNIYNFSTAFFITLS